MGVPGRVEGVVVAAEPAVPVVQSSFDPASVTECLECSGSSAAVDSASVEGDSAPFAVVPCAGCFGSLASCSD